MFALVLDIIFLHLEAVLKLVIKIIAKFKTVSFRSKQNKNQWKGSPVL